MSKVKAAKTWKIPGHTRSCVLKIDMAWQDPWHPMAKAWHCAQYITCRGLCYMSQVHPRGLLIKVHQIYAVPSNPIQDTIVELNSKGPSASVLSASPCLEDVGRFGSFCILGIEESSQTRAAKQGHSMSRRTPGRTRPTKTAGIGSHTWLKPVQIGPS